MEWWGALQVAGLIVLWDITRLIGQTLWFKKIVEKSNHPSKCPDCGKEIEDGKNARNGQA